MAHILLILSLLLLLLTAIAAIAAIAVAEFYLDDVLAESLDNFNFENHNHIGKDHGTNIRRNFVSATFGSNMVLQRDKPVVVWGFSKTPGATVMVEFHGSKETTIENATTVANDDGFWRHSLQPQKASLEPIWLEFQSTAGEHAKLDNLLFGDVYLCGGQSNMAFDIPANTNGTKEAKRGNDYPHIRIFTVGTGTSSDVPLPDLQTILQPWSVASEQSLFNPTKHSMFDYFSSVCWFFGREIADGLNNQVPIGLISNNWGGTRIEQWSVHGALYKSMINPYMMGPMALTGFTWYQGESNAHNQQEADNYAHQFPEMIQSWREGFGIPDAYFGFVQLSTCCDKDKEAMALVRQSQMKAMTRVLGKIAYATNADRGDACNVHPPAKQDCGMRLGRSALAVQYGQSNIHWKSPTYHRQQLQSTLPHTNQIPSVVIQFQDVSPQGLYLISIPYSIDPHRPTAEKTPSRCEDQEPGTCAGAQVLLNNRKGWVNATIKVHSRDEIKFIAKVPHGNNGEAATIVATSYGWALLPLMTIYDKGTNLPVLPWREKVTDEGEELATNPESFYR